MKFYFTILIAGLLFGLCLIERKAKEEETILKNATSEESFVSKNLTSKPSTESRNAEKGLFKNTKLVSNTSSDSIMNQTFAPQKSMLNVSLSSPFFGSH